MVIRWWFRDSWTLRRRKEAELEGLEVKMLRLSGAMRMDKIKNDSIRWTTLFDGLEVKLEMPDLDSLDMTGGGLNL